MNAYQWLCLFGVPALAAAIGRLIWYFVKKKAAEDAAYRLGLQALLRAQMVNDYNHYVEKGYAPIYARENFENCYQRYHALGVNGVMDDLHDKFLQLPTKEVNKDGK